MKTKPNNVTPENRSESQTCRCIAIAALIVLLLTLAASVRGANGDSTAFNPEIDFTMGGL